MTFLETVKEFEAKPTEKGIPLHDKHHAHVKQATASFAEKLEELKGKGHKIDIKQGPNEKKAQAYLDAFLMMQLAAEDEKELITKAKKAIGKGKFQHLQRDINKLEKNTKQAPMKPVALLEALITILKSYPLNQLDEQELAQNGTNPSLLAQFLSPDIIISESFSL